MSGADIAAQIAAALAEAGEVTGSGPMACTIRKAGSGPSTPWDTTPEGAPQYLAVSASLEDVKDIKDGTGAVVSQVRVLTIPSGAEPTTADMIAVGVPAAEATEASPWEAITRVTPFAPTGDVLFYEVELHV